MTKRTRLFLLTAIGVLIAVLTTGLVAWLTDVQLFAALGNSAAELAYVPGNSRMVAYADVREVMNSPFRDRFRTLQRTNPDPNGIEARTGIRFDTDVDSLVMASAGPDGDAARQDRALIIARGRFDAVRIEGLMRNQGGQVSDYRGKRVVSVQDARNDSAISFVEPGLLVFGTLDSVRAAIDAKAGSAPGLSANAELMALVDDVDEGTAWSVARFDSLAAQPGLPQASAVLNQLPPIDWLAASGRIDTGLHGFLRAETRDPQSAADLRDVVQGFLALVKIQGSRDPAYKGMLDSVALSSTGKSVSLSFDVTPAVLDSLGNATRRAPAR